MLSNTREGEAPQAEAALFHQGQRRTAHPVTVQNNLIRSSEQFSAGVRDCDRNLLPRRHHIGLEDDRGPLHLIIFPGDAGPAGGQGNL